MRRRASEIHSSVEKIATAVDDSLQLLEELKKQVGELAAKTLDNENRLHELRNLVIRLDESKSTLIAQHIAGVVDGVSMSVGSQISSQVERLQADLADARQQILGTLYKG
jgi:hypothetical protein